MTTKLVLLGLTLVSCSSAETPAEPDDAGPDGAALDASWLSELTSSRNAWNTLVATMGDTYSYAEENCLVNATSHTVTTIQVERGVARLFATTMIPTSQCLASVNRYDDFRPRTLPELYDQCEALLRREGNAVKVELDDDQVLRGCSWPGERACTDNCGEGFYLRAWSFGQLEVP